MSIKPFEEYWDESGLEYIVPDMKSEFQDCYNKALAESVNHYEEEKIQIHSYYDMRLRELFGNKNPLVEPSEENGGKLT